jgi:hypothetical protein
MVDSLCLLCARQLIPLRIFRNQQSALHYAVESNKPGSVEALVKMKADLDIRDW